MLFQSVLNFGLFWPLGWYFFKRMPVKKALLWGAGISLALELLQWLLRRAILTRWMLCCIGPV